MRPANHAIIWSDANTLYLELPSPIEGARSHVVNLPNTPQGLEHALALINARSNATNAVLSTEAAPTKEQLRASFERSVKPAITRPRPQDRFSPELRQAARDVLRRVGILGVVRR